MRSPPLNHPAVYALLPLPLLRVARADQNFVPTDLVTQPPSCARDCINKLVSSEFKPFVCGPTPTAKCFCTNYQNAGPSFGDITLFCMTNYCDSTSGISLSNFYGLCTGPLSTTQSSATASTPLSHTATTIPLTSTEPSVSAAEVSSSTTNQTPTGSVLQAAAPTATQSQVTAQATSLPPGYSVMNPGEIAAIAVGTVVSLVVISILASILVSACLSRREQRQRQHDTSDSRRPPGSRFASSSALTITSSIEAAYEKRAEEGLGLGMGMQELRTAAQQSRTNGMGMRPPNVNDKHADTAEATPSSRYSSERTVSTQLLASEQESRSAPSDVAQNPMRPPQAFISGKSALWPQVNSGSLAKLPNPSKQSKPTHLRLQIPESNGKNVFLPPRELPVTTTFGGGVSGSTSSRRSVRYNTDPNSPAPRMPPPSLPIGVRRTSRPDYMPSYYSKTRQQQLATPTSALSSGMPPAGTSADRDIGGQLMYPPSSFGRHQVASGFPDAGTEEVKMNLIKSGIRNHDSTTSTADTSFELDSNLTPEDDDGPSSDMPTQRAPQPLSQPHVPRRQSPGQMQMETMSTNKSFNHRRFGSSLLQRHRGGDYERRLERSPCTTESNGQSTPAPMIRDAWAVRNRHNGPKHVDVTSRGSSDDRQLRQQPPQQSPGWDPKLTPRRAGPDGDMYFDVHL